MRGRGECLEQIAFEARHQDLGLGVAEARVELEHARAVLGQHQAGEQAPHERRSAAGELSEHGLVDLFDQGVGALEPRHGSIGAHAAGIRAHVAVADALEVLCGAERHDAAPVGDSEERDLVALEQLLDDHLAAQGRGRPQPFVDLRLRPAHEDALARGQAVGLHDTGWPRDGELLRRRDAGREQNVLAEGLRPLDPGRRCARAEDREAVAPELVADAGDERGFRADHHEIRRDGSRQVDEAVGVVCPHRMALGQRRDARIARRGVEGGQARAPGEPPRECVLACTRADEQDLHGPSLVAVDRGGRRSRTRFCEPGSVVLRGCPLVLGRAARELGFLLDPRGGAARPGRSSRRGERTTRARRR